MISATKHLSRESGEQNGFKLNRFIRIGVRLACAAGVISTTFLGAPSASAASGGGCSLYVDGNAGPRGQYVDIKPCLNSPKRTIGRPSAYITLRQGHPACKIHIYVLRTGDSKVMSKKVHTCPQGTTRMKQFTAPDFKVTSHHDGEAYATYTQIQWATGEGTLPYRSPWLQLP